MRSRSRPHSRTAESSEAYDRWLDLLDELGEVERWVSTAWVAGRDVEISEPELDEALRRALVVRAVGGSPQREVALDEEAVLRLAAELDGAERRAALRRGLEFLRAHVTERPVAAAAVDSLLEDGDLAWHCFAAAQVADAVSS